MNWKEAVIELRESFKQNKPCEVGEPERRAEEILSKVQTLWQPDQLASARTKLIREARGEYD